MDGLIQDIRYGLRTLAKNPGFSILAILTLGLGIGANTAIFSAINGVLLKPLPYGDGDRLVLIRQSAPLAGRADTGVSVREYYDYREQSADFEALVEYHQMSFDLLKRGDPDRVATGVVSYNFFDVLGITPLQGRTFRRDDEQPGAPAVLILSHSYWRTKFGGDPGIVGQVFEMNDRPHTVVGVLPEVPHYPQENDVYMPVSACPFRAQAERTQLQNRRAFSALNVFGRLKADVPPERAAAGVATIAGRFTSENPTVYRPGSGFTGTTAGVRDELTRNARPMLFILLGTTGLVLLIACANVASLALARLLRRDRELAVRAALGAGRGRLVRQLLTESTILSLAGGVAGLLFAVWTIDMLGTFISQFTSRTGEVAVDLRVLAFTMALALGTGLLFGTLPAIAARADVSTALKHASKGGGQNAIRRRLQSALIAGQVAVASVLLLGAGLLLASFFRLTQVDPGYRADRVLSAEVFTNFSQYPNVDAQLAFYQPVLERLSAQPGIVAAAITNAVPLSTVQPGSTPFDIEGRATDNPDARPTADVRIASPKYFDTLGVPLLRGRTFGDGDGRDNQPVTVINHSMTRYWDGADPIGSRVSFNGGRTWSTVVGIVGDVKQFGLSRDAVAQVYTPLAQARQNLGGQLVLVRTNGDPTTAGGVIRDAVRAVDPNMPIENVRTLDELRDRNLSTPRLTAILLSVFAAVALIVTMTGITGMVATSVTQRQQEFGIRMALGETRDSILRMVIRQGLMPIAIGLAAGVAAGIGLTRVLSSYLFSTAPTDPATLAAVAVALLAGGTVAAAGPAWRATKVDPMVALRVD
jgi:putative ABC transport system permease protein